jgi:plastocyanin
MKRMITLMALLIASANTFAADIAISITDNSFSSAGTVDVGDVITWTNNGGNSHTVTSTINIPAGANSFDQTLSPSQTFQYTVAVAGSYEYRCKFHGGMTGSFSTTTPASISKAVNELPVKLFPNPTTDQVTIDMQNVSADMIKVADSKGVFIKQVVLSAISQNIDLSDLTEGVYSLSFYHNEKLLGYKKLVKN